MSKPVLLFILILAIALVLRLFVFYLTKPIYKDGEHINFSSKVLSDPKVYKTYQNFSAELPSGDRVFIKTDIYPEYYYQDKIMLSGNLKYQLLNNKTQILTMDFPQIEAVKTSGNNLLAVTNSIRQKIINTFQTSLSKNSAGLMLGIVFGIKQNLSKDFLDDLKVSGVMHVIAASGMNVTMTGGLMFYVFSLFLKRQLAIISSIFAILFYAFLAGFEPSIVRASIMGIIAFSALVLGKQQYSFYALCLTGFAMLFFQPKFLSDIGFQLSFISTLGILYIPLIFKKWQNAFTGNFLTTVSAQTATLPILLTNFGTYSLWSIVTNILVLWTVPLLMVLGGIAAIISFVFEPLARVILYLALPFLIYFQQTVSIFSRLEGVIKIETFPWQFIAAYYLFLTSFLIFKLRKLNE